MTGATCVAGSTLSLVQLSLILQEEERDPDLAFRDIAKFGILQIAGLFLINWFIYIAAQKLD